MEGGDDSLSFWFLSRYSVVFRPIFVVLVSILGLKVSRVASGSSGTIFLCVFLVLLPILRERRFRLLVRSNVFPFCFFCVCDVGFLCVFSPRASTSVLVIYVLRVSDGARSRVSFLFFKGPLYLFRIQASLSNSHAFRGLPVYTLCGCLVQLRLICGPTSSYRSALLYSLFLVGVVFGGAFLAGILRFYDYNFPSSFFFVSYSRHGLRFLVFFYGFCGFQCLCYRSSVSRFFCVFYFFWVFNGVHSFAAQEFGGKRFLFQTVGGRVAF